MQNLEPLLCPACDRPPEIKTQSAGLLRKLYTVYCATEGCQFRKTGVGLIEENAVKSWNDIVKWTKEK